MGKLQFSRGFQETNRELTHYYRVGDNPFGVAPITPPLPKTEQHYDVSITMTLPESPRNTGRGNFMVALHLLDTDLSKSMDVLHSPESGRSLVDPQSVIYTTRRPALMPYVDPAVSLARRLAWLPFRVVFPKNDVYFMTLPLAENVVFSRSSRVPKSIYVEVQAGQDLQTYEAAVTMTANLRGLRWILHNYRIVSFITLTLGFWSMEMLFAGLMLFTLGAFVGSDDHPPKPELEDSEKREEDDLGEVKLEERMRELPSIKREHSQEDEREREREDEQFLRERTLERRSSEDHGGGLRRRRSIKREEEGESSASGGVGIKREPDSD